MKKLNIKTLIFTIAFLLGLYKAPSQVQAQTPDHFDVSLKSTANKAAGLPFIITVTAKDAVNATITSFNSSTNLSESSGTIYPATIDGFSSGVWQGNVYITRAGTSYAVSATYSTATGTSSTFNIDADDRIRFLTIYGGNNQSGSVMALLPTTLQVQVVDPYNNAISGETVNFAIASYPPGASGQSLSSLSGTTGSNGRKSTTLTLGNKTGTYEIAVETGSGASSYVTFYESAIAGVLYSMQITPATGVIPLGGFIGFTATGYDQYQNEVSITPTWSVQNGGGSVDQAGIFLANTASGTFLNTVKAQSGSAGSTASVTIISSGSGSGATATFSATPTPSPTVAPTSLPAGVLNDVYVDPAVISALADAEIAIAATAVDSSGNAITQGVNFSFEVSGDLGTITQTGESSVLLTASEGGIGTITVRAQQGNIVKIAKIVGSVGTGLNRRLIVEPVDSPQRVGEPFTISIAAKNSLNEFVTDYTGPIVLADTTGTLDPGVLEPNEDGIWYVQAIIQASNSEVSISVAGDGMVGVSNIFEVTGEPSMDELYSLGTGKGDGGLGEVLGSSISAKLKELFQDKDLNKYTIARYIGAGLAGGIGILGASIGGGLMASKGLEAIGRNPFAKGKLKANLYLSIIGFLAAAALAVYAAFLIIQ